MYPNGLQSTFTYDTQNRVTALSNAAANYTYTLDGTVGNRKGVTERLVSKPSPRIVAWNYDNIYRLTNENISADPNSKTGEVTYGLDPVGNRLSLGLSTGSNLPGISPIQLNSISYDHDDRLSTETYDANGNTLTTGGKTFAYDFENRLKSLNGGTVTIQYDADGNRVAKTVAGVTTRYLVDDLNPTGYAQVVEEVTAGAVTRQYTYGLQRISQTQQIANAWTPTFYGYDGGGTVRLLTDNTGTVTDTYDYDAWGNTVNTTGSTPNVYLYRGEQYDADLDLYYLRARNFNPVAGRFLTTDPNAGNITAPSTLHRYTYAGADPVNRLDPTGRAAMIEGVLLDAFVLTEWAGASPKTTSMARSIYCIWDEATSWLKLGVWVDQLPPGYGVTGLVRNECEVRASARTGKGKCPWHKAKRPLKGAPIGPGEVCHEYFYNPLTGVSIGLGPATGTGLFGTVPRKWETGEKPGEDLGPVDDSICDCVSRKLASMPNSPPPPYFGLRWFPRDNAASNCWAWVSSIERQCRGGSSSPANPGVGVGMNAY